MSTKYQRRLALLATVLVFGTLLMGSCLLNMAPQSNSVTAIRDVAINEASLEAPESQDPVVTPTSEIYLPRISRTLPKARVYYVDSTSGMDGYSCTTAQNPATPKKTVEGVMNCPLVAGDTVKFRGTFSETIYPSTSGQVLYNVQNIAQVSESSVGFKINIFGINPATDYVAIYGSRMGNSGAFAISSVSQNVVTVDTQFLPGGKFIPETEADPGTLQAAILRPIHFTAWDNNNPPVFNTQYQVYHVINQRVLMVSHLKSIGGHSINPGYYVWPAFEIDGNNNGNSDFQIFDHLEVTNAEAAIAIEFDDFQSNYDIVQFNYLHDTGSKGNASDEVIYWGNDIIDSNRRHNYAQIMYNKIGPHQTISDDGDGIEIKETAQNATVFGNEIVGTHPNGCSDAPIRVSGINAFVANNYIHDINPLPPFLGCGISIVDDYPADPESGGKGAIIVNNIVANVQDVGILVLDSVNVQILNNTIYNIFPRPNCDSTCKEEIMGIKVQNWQGPTTDIIIKNNIVQFAHIGIGRYIWSHNEYPVSIDSDYNIVFNSDIPFGGTITQNSHDYVVNPKLVDPQNQNYAIVATSLARDSGIDLASEFLIDNHDATDPTLIAITAPMIRISFWDRGAFEYR